MPETWAAIPGFSGYEVSDLGNVRTWKQGHRYGPLTRDEPLLKSQSSQKGKYRRVLLCQDGRHRHYLVHRLVLLAFAGEPPRGFQCCHIDGNPSNNMLGNLMWGSPETNYEQRESHGRVVRGERHYCAKLTEVAVRQVKAFYRQEKYNSINAEALAVRFGVSQAAVWCVAHGRTWRHVA